MTVTYHDAVVLSLMPDNTAYLTCVTDKGRSRWCSTAYTDRDTLYADLITTLATKRPPEPIVEEGATTELPNGLLLVQKAPLHISRSKVDLIAQSRSDGQFSIGNTEQCVFQYQTQPAASLGMAAVRMMRLYDQYVTPAPTASVPPSSPHVRNSVRVIVTKTKQCVITVKETAGSQERSWYSDTATPEQLADLLREAFTTIRPGAMNTHIQPECILSEMRIGRDADGNYLVGSPACFMHRYKELGDTIAHVVRWYAGYVKVPKPSSTAVKLCIVKVTMTNDGRVIFTHRKSELSPETRAVCSSMSDTYLRKVLRTIFLTNSLGGIGAHVNGHDIPKYAILGEVTLAMLAGHGYTVQRTGSSSIHHFPSGDCAFDTAVSFLPLAQETAAPPTPEMFVMGRLQDGTVQIGYRAAKSTVWHRCNWEIQTRDVADRSLQRLAAHRAVPNGKPFEPFGTSAFTTDLLAAIVRTDDDPYEVIIYRSKEYASGVYSRHDSIMDAIAQLLNLFYPKAPVEEPHWKASIVFDQAPDGCLNVWRIARAPAEHIFLRRIPAHLEQIRRLLSETVAPEIAMQSWETQKTPGWCGGVQISVDLWSTGSLVVTSNRHPRVAGPVEKTRLPERAAQVVYELFLSAN